MCWLQSLLSSLTPFILRYTLWAGQGMWGQEYTPQSLSLTKCPISNIFLLATLPSCSFHMDTSSPSESWSEIHFQGESRTLYVCPEMGHWAFPPSLSHCNFCCPRLPFPMRLSALLLLFRNLSPFFCKPPLCFFFIMLQIGHPFSVLVYVFENKCKRNHCLQVHKMK